MAGVFLAQASISSGKVGSLDGVLGGPEYSGVSGHSVADLALADTSMGAQLGGVDGVSIKTSVASVAFKSSLADVAVAGSKGLSNFIPYTVAKGDSLKKVAARFKVSVDSVVATNPGMTSRSSLKVGQIVNILTVPGMLYRVQVGESADKIAANYHLSLAALQSANQATNFNSLDAGSVLVIPGVKPTVQLAMQSTDSSLPDLHGYFIMPTKGYNWGIMHDHNAVDIANSCGTPVVAAAEGLVIPDANLGDGSSGWNAGYGHFVLVEHPNGTRTRYAHLSDVFVNPGDYLKQGDRLGSVGNTGNVHGPTGCHLHFEVYGAKNPFVRS